MLIAVPARLYFTVHGALRPLIALYRMFHPIPRSPEPRSEDDRFRLKLVPADHLEHRFDDVLDYLEKVGGEPLANYVEFGVYNGTSMSCFYRALSKRRSTSARLIGFDSFQGLPPGAELEDGGVWRVGQFTCPIEVARANLCANGIPEDRVQLVEGWFSETLTNGTAPDVGRVSVVMIDSDTRSAAELALAFIEPKLTKVAVICFDDWKLNDLDVHDMGEYRAFREFVKNRPNLSVGISRGYNRKSKIAIIRRRLA